MVVGRWTKRQHDQAPIKPILRSVMCARDICARAGCGSNLISDCHWSFRKYFRFEFLAVPSSCSCQAEVDQQHLMFELELPTYSLLDLQVHMLTPALDHLLWPLNCTMATQFVTRTMRAAPRVACATRKAITRTSTLSSTAYQREIEFSPAPTSPPWRVGASSHAGDSTLDATSQRSNLLAEASPLVSMAFQEHEESVEQDCSAADSIADLRPLYENSTRGLECGDLRLGQFMEEVKTELWQYNAMPFRKRFRVQSLLR